MNFNRKGQSILTPPNYHQNPSPQNHSKRKDGSEGNLVKIPELRDVQADPATRLKWIGYSALDAKCVHPSMYIELIHFDSPP